MRGIRGYSVNVNAWFLTRSSARGFVGIPFLTTQAATIRSRWGRMSIDGITVKVTAENHSVMAILIQIRVNAMSDEYA
jgi:hypothetical protein